MITEPYRGWIERWEKTLNAVRAAGGEGDEIMVAPPAKEAEIVATESKIGRRLPASFRRVLLEFSGSVCVSWRLLSADHLAREEVGRAYAGDVLISLRGVEGAERCRRDDCMGFEKRPRVGPEPLARWTRSLAWWELDGSAVAFDMRGEGSDAAVVTLERDVCWGDSWAWLAPDFLEFMDRWTRIGSVGPIWWMLDPFIKKPWGGLDPDSEHARAWRDALGLDL